VALQWGLIVPVIKRAEEQNFLGIARSIADIAERARGKKLAPDEVLGGTFTLTNSGIFGEQFGMPIINQPQAAILGIGGLNKEPVVVTDEDGSDSIAIRSMQHFCLGSTTASWTARTPASSWPTSRPAWRTGTRRSARKRQLGCSVKSRYNSAQCDTLPLRDIP